MCLRFFRAGGDGSDANRPCGRDGALRVVAGQGSLSVVGREPFWCQASPITVQNDRLGTFIEIARNGHVLHGVKQQ